MAATPPATPEHGSPARSGHGAACEPPPDSLTPEQRAWVTALRSGKYEQAQDALTPLDDDGEPTGYCCFGVACEIALAAGVKVEVGSTTLTRTYDGASAVPPEPVWGWLGLRGENPELPGLCCSLASSNDEGATFAEIADLIERHADRLFVDRPAA